MKQNATFKGWEPTWANACVGENGNPQIYEYASGYASAANLLLDQVIEKEGRSLYVDIFIYPICFNMRHAIELFLKAAAVSLEQLAKIRSSAIPAFDLTGSHDLGNIWTYVREHASQFDLRYVELLTELNRYVADVAEIDATGQVFRYPFDLDNNKHLTSVSVINVVILKERWAILERLLKNLNRLNDDLLIEYGWGGFTAKLSRLQLAQIAAALPARDQWSLLEFDQVKSDLCKKYTLSSNDFSKALHAIQSRRELAAICGHVIPIPGLDVSALQQFLEIWMKKHDLAKIVAPPSEFDPGRDFVEPNFEEMISYYEESEKLQKELVKTVKPGAFAALRALFYFDREDAFSEVFEKLLIQYQKASAEYANVPASYFNDARHLLEKTSAFVSILNSLNFLGQAEMVNAVVDRYQLHGQVSKLLEPSERARARILQGHLYT
nr:hypothetical protein [uncultured Albidiferax sp.]